MKTSTLPSQAGLPERLDKLFSALARSDAPGAVVGIAHQGRVIFRRAYGLASVEHGVANTVVTRMRIGSSSKQFTCLGAFLLAEQGRLDIDAPIGRCIPELSSVAGRPTLRQLMQHTGGGRDYLDMATTAAGLALQAPGRALAAQSRQREANFEPGHGQLYCNGGYHLLSIAIERAAGKPFGEVLRERLFAPLGLHDTANVPSDMQIVPGLSTMHVSTADGRWRRGIFPTEEVLGEGGMVSTVDDMLAWLAHLREPHLQGVGTNETWQQMLAPAVLASGQPTNYACGLWRHAWRGVELVYHGGNVYGGSSQLLTVPAHALDIVILCNGALVSPVELGKQVVEAVLTGALKGPAPGPVASRGFEHLFGVRYHHPETGLVLGFDDAAGRLAVSMNTSPAAPILHRHGRTLRVGFEVVAMGPFVWQLADLAAGRDGQAPQRLPISESGHTVVYQRLPARAPAAGEAGRRLHGHYRSHDLNTDAWVRQAEDGSLQMLFRGPEGSRLHTLQALSSQVFGVTVVDEVYPGRYVLTADAPGSRGAPVPGFRISTARTRRLHFARVSQSGEAA